MKTYLFVNPASGHHTPKRMQEVLKRLYEAGKHPEVFEVRTPPEIFSYCNIINKDPEPHLVIVAGGDGTFNAVVNGLESGSATLAVLPFGTSNVLAAEIGIRSIDDGLARITAGKTAPLSVGILEMETRTLRFVLMAGIGLDGAVVRDVWPWGKRLLRQGAYALAALKMAMKWDRTLFEISGSEEHITCHTAIICNASRYGGNFILSPESSPFRPGLSAVCITGNKRLNYIKSAMELFRGKAETSRDLIRMFSSTFEIRGESPIQIDGDFVGYGPAHISEHSDFGRIIV